MADDGEMETNARKDVWRRTALAARRARMTKHNSKPEHRRHQISATLTKAIGIAQGSGAPNSSRGSMAVYEPLPSEPDVAEFTALMESEGSDVLVPNPRFPGDADSPPFVTKGEELTPATSEVLGLIIVPALALGADGSRLGRGGGWYDRAIEWVADHQTRRPLLVGVCFDGETHESGQIPTAPHDVRVDVVATDKGFLVVDGGYRQVFAPQQ